MKPCIFILLSLVLFGLEAKCQELSKNRSTKIFNSPADLFKLQSPDGKLKSCRYNPFIQKVVVHYAGGQRTEISPDSIWGFQPNGEYPTRISEGQLYRINRYELLADHPFYVYSQHVFRSSNYYFSTSATGNIYKLSETNLKAQLDANAYDSLLANKWIRHLMN